MRRRSHAPAAPETTRDRVRRALRRLAPPRVRLWKRAERERVHIPTARASKSAAVRAALLNPSARQRSKWRREARKRQLVYGAAAIVAVLVVGVLVYGYW